MRVHAPVTICVLAFAALARAQATPNPAESPPTEAEVQPAPTQTVVEPQNPDQAQQPTATSTGAPEESTEAERAAQVQPPSERKVDPSPAPELTPPPRIRFVADPISDGALLSLTLGVAFMSEQIIGTGEITPQQPQTRARLLSIDRGVIETEPVPAWGTISNIGLWGALTFAAVDPIVSGSRYGVQAGIVDAFIYAETISTTWALTNIAKISFRRPRPSAYQEAERLEAEGREVEISSTNSALSFFSGHSAITASVSATATYLAFSRDRHSARPWITLGVGALTTTLVAIGRVKDGDHFPTDVIAGAMAGAGIGVLVPHLHRVAPAKQRHVWIGMAPAPRGGSIVAEGTFL